MRLLAWGIVVVLAALSGGYAIPLGFAFELDGLEIYAAATLGSDAFDAMHERLMEAYFADNRNITDTDVQRELWSEVGLSPEAFERVSDPALLQATLREHQEALDAGVTGVPRSARHPRQVHPSGSRECPGTGSLPSTRTPG